MADVNEEIVIQYIKLVKQWLYVSDIPFRVPKNYSNIDILAYDPKDKKYYDIEVKYRSAFTIPATNRNGRNVSKKSVLPYTKQFVKYSTRNKAMKNFCHNKKPIKLLVTTQKMFGKSEKKRKQIESAFKSALKKRGYHHSQVWYFDDIIPTLYKTVSKEGRHNTELLQTIRMIKVYIDKDS